MNTTNTNEVKDDNPHPPRLSEHRKRFTRDGTLFLCGLIGIGYETAISKTDRPTLLLLFAAMIGLPAFLNKDEKNLAKEREEGSNDES